MMKHNKKRNTAFLYEILVKEAAKQLYVNNNVDKYSKAVALIREMTEGNTELSRDLKTYLVLRTQIKQKEVAVSILNETMQERANINESKLFNEQTNFISKINTQIGAEVFNNFIGDYRILGNIYHLFHNSKKMPIKDRSILKEMIVASMTKPEVVLRETMESIDSITYNILIKKFNEKYKGVLNESQKNLIKTYLSSGESETEFKFFLNEEIERLKKVLVEAKEANPEIHQDQEMVEKTNKIVGLLNEFKSKKYNDKMIEDVMRIQSLVEEIEKNDKN